MAEQMTQQNPELVEQLRAQMGGADVSNDTTNSSDNTSNEPKPDQ